MALCRSHGAPMRIDCPSCQAAYDVPDRLLSAGRTVRCARCGGEWTPHPETSPEHKGPNQEPQQAASRPAHELPPAPELPHPTAMERLAQQAPRLATPSSALRAPWGAPLALLVLLV